MLDLLGSAPRAHARRKPPATARREATLFRKKFLASLGRQQGWTAGDALDFQQDLQVYEQLLGRAKVSKRIQKPYEVANHPFVDRAAFLLDSSFLEQARMAASRVLAGIVQLAETATERASLAEAREERRESRP